MKRECHPEKGYLGSGSDGCVTYGGYNALGLAGSRQEAGTGYDLTFSYDPTGRLTQVARSNGVLLKEFFYGKANQGGNLQAGKLYQAKRHNLLVDPTRPGPTPTLTNYIVTETYRYEGPDGRLSDRRTTLTDQGQNSSGSQSFVQSFAYDELGNLAGQNYPSCHHQSCLGQEPTRQISYSYRDGLLVGVPGYVSKLTYHGNGALAQVRHTNDLTDTIGLDPDGMPRPASMRTETSGGNALWASGGISYDAAGNITAMGSDRFFYDEVSRLKKAKVWLSGAETTEEYTYDRFGNLTTVATPSGDRVAPVDPRTNRLDPRRLPIRSSRQPHQQPGRDLPLRSHCDGHPGNGYGQERAIHLHRAG